MNRMGVHKFFFALLWVFFFQVQPAVSSGGDPGMYPLDVREGKSGEVLSSPVQQPALQDEESPDEYGPDREDNDDQQQEFNAVDDDGNIDQDDDRDRGKMDIDLQGTKGEGEDVKASEMMDTRPPKRTKQEIEEEKRKEKCKLKYTLNQSYCYRVKSGNDTELDECLREAEENLEKCLRGEGSSFVWGEKECRDLPREMYRQCIKGFR